MKNNKTSEHYIFWKVKKITQMLRTKFYCEIFDNNFENKISQIFKSLL